MNNCKVCDEKYNKSLIKEIKCDKCDFSSCLSCYKNYFASCNKEANCMECKELFNYSFLYNNFHRKYIDKKYKQLLEEILYNNEISFFPETLPYIEQHMKKQKILEKINTLETEIKTLYNELDNTDIVKQQYIKKCMTSDCKGFLNTDWFCSLCEKKYCKKCFEEKENSHICIEDNINSANLIKKETKSCPSCSINIYKIDGCDQFFCTNCNTCFDWKSLKIYDSKTRVHNPHYFEYLQKKSNTVEINYERLDNYFENILIDQEMFEYYYRNWSIKDPRHIENKYISFLFKIFTNMNHFIQETSIIINQINEGNRDKRILFLTNEITLEEFKEDIQKKYKNNQKIENISIKINDLVKISNRCIIDLFKLKFEKKLNKDTFNDVFTTYIDNLDIYNNEITLIGKTFKCSVKKYLNYPFKQFV